MWNRLASTATPEYNDRQQRSSPWHPQATWHDVDVAWQPQAILKTIWRAAGG
jgi:hypothetical protein